MLERLPRWGGGRGGSCGGSTLAARRRFRVSWCRRHPDAGEREVMEKFNVSYKTAVLLLRDARS
jgi:hypothetical protein